MTRIVVRPAARRDLIHHFAYIGERAGVEVARRFKEAARSTFAQLSNMPKMGSFRKFGKFIDVRMWRVRDFENYLIFYRPLENSIRIERVIHAAQDYTRIAGT